MAKYHKSSLLQIKSNRVNGDLAVSPAFGDAQHKTTGGLRIDLQFKSSCRDTANVLYLLHTSSVFYRSSRSEVTEVWWLRTVGPTFSKLLKLDLNISQGPEPQDHPVCAALELKES